MNINQLIAKLKSENFVIDTSKEKLNPDIIHGYLVQSYWAQNIPKKTVLQAIEHSFCFGVYRSGQQAGFARLITDFCTFAYLADVFILKEFRGRGLSKWLMHEIINHPDLQGLRRWSLTTADAHGLYKQFGFSALKKPHVYMERHDPDIYNNKDLY